jgi:hypothetical protein
MNAAERRQNRSNARGRALELLVHACRTRGDLSVLVVADEAGLLVAESGGPGVAALTIAALAPAAVGGPVSGVHAVSLDCDGDRYYLAFLGEPANDWLAAAIDGARRILAA